MAHQNNQPNPFVIGKYVSDEFFCDREKDTELVKKQITNGRNMTLIADRRIGKSGLISHVFAQPDIQQDYYTIIVDLFATNSLSEMVSIWGKELYRQVQIQSKSWRDKFFDVLTSLRVGLKYDPVSGMPTFDLGMGDISMPKLTLDQIFDYLEMADKPCVVAFDEFQQIMYYPEKNIEALLRTYIQRCKKTQFIFAGSRKHMMTEMFLSPARPFYQSTINLGLGLIPLEIYVDFAQKMFKRGEKAIEADAVEEIYNTYHGVTWYLQLLMNEMYYLTPKGGTCTKESIEPAIQNTLRVQESTFLNLLANIPPRQKELLFAIAKAGIAENINSSEFIQKYKLQSSSSIQSALKGLEEKDIVICSADKKWRIYDTLLEQYIRRYIVNEEKSSNGFVYFEKK
jgi:AAA+ ATPase superfamily predicted ATPase